MIVVIDQQTEDKIKNDIANILYERGEGFQNDEGIDENVCAEVANEIITYLKSSSSGNVSGQELFLENRK